MISPRLKEFVSAMSLEGLAIPQAPPPSTTSTTVGSADFSIEYLADCYRIHGVQFRDGIYQVDVSKALLPKGTQEEHAQRRKEALTNNSFYTPDFPLFHGVINTLCKNREGSFKDQIEEAKTFLSDLVKDRWLMTLTRIRYTPSGQDLVIHNYGQDDKYEIPSDFVGLDGAIIKPETNAGAALQVLLNTHQSPQELDQVYKWFRNTDTYIWRLSNRLNLKSVDERVVGFYAGSLWADLYCYGGPSGSAASLGVRARKIG